MSEPDRPNYFLSFRKQNKEEFQAFALRQWFPNFFWSRTICESLTVTTYQGRTQGGVWGYPPLWAWYFTNTLLPAQKRL